MAALPEPHPQDRFRLLQMRHASAPPPDVTESSEAPQESTHAADPGDDGEFERVRWERWESGAYARLGLIGLARMAWARHRADEPIDKLDRFAMEHFTWEECKW